MLKSQHLLTALACGAALTTGTAAAAQSYSFEEPSVNGYAYNPTAFTGATFSNKSGVSNDTSYFFNVMAPDGSQAAFIQSVDDTQSVGDGQGFVSLSFDNLTVGDLYQVTFYLAPRPDYLPDAVSVSFNGVDLGSYAPTNPNDSRTFIKFNTPDFVATSTSGALLFRGAPTTDGDNDTNLDLVMLSAGTVPTPAVPEAATWTMMILGIGAIGFAMRRRTFTTRVSYAA